MSIAKNFIMNKAFADQYLSHKEVNELLATVFNRDDAQAPIDDQQFLGLKETLQSYQSAQVYTKLAQLNYENADDKKRLALLIKSYPGNLEGYLDTLKAQGLDQGLNLNVTLPKVSFEAIYADTENSELIHVMFKVDGESQPRDLVINTRLVKGEKQDYESEDPFNGVLLSDALTALDELANHTGWNDQALELTPEEMELRARLSDYYMSHPDTYQAKSRIDNEGEISVIGVDASSSTSLHAVGTQTPLVVDSDGTQSDANIASVLLEVQTIVGEEFMRMLANSGIHMAFVDKSELAIERMAKEADVRSDSDLIVGLTDYENSLISIDANRGRSEQLWTIIHELSHQLNEMLQLAGSGSVQSYIGINASGAEVRMSHVNYDGAQIEEFAETQKLYNGSDKSLPYFASRYAQTNYAEWFADSYTVYALERAGRYDVIEQNPGIEDSVRLYGLLLTDPVLYAVMAKVDHIIRNKDADPASFAFLQETGLSRELFLAAKDHVYATLPYRESSIASERRSHPDQFPAAQAAWLKNWEQKPLESILRAHAEEASEESEFRTTVRDEFANFQDPAVQRNYLPDAFGVSARDARVNASTDYFVVSLAIQLDRASNDLEKVNILIANGIHTEEELGNVLDSLNVLSPSEAMDVLNPVIPAVKIVNPTVTTGWWNGYGLLAPSAQPYPTVVMSTLVNEAHKEYARRLQSTDE